MNIVKTFNVFYQNKNVEVKIEKSTDELFIGRCLIDMCNEPIEYKQTGTSAEDVEEKMMDFFQDKHIKKGLDASNM